ncbi:MAG: hypothetical protein ACD_19C00402G0004 [uncultured bacterium]|nr:MAG: hypothetical protein ACD_19C00402G0004 [uncultured bacterium]
MSATLTTTTEELGLQILEVLKHLSTAELRESRFVADVYVQEKFKERYNSTLIRTDKSYNTVI